MIVSHKYKFIFIKTIKTAGTSIEVFLSQHCGISDIVTPIYPYVEPHTPRNFEGFYNHMPAHMVRGLLPRSIWDSYFKFCVERNPWDKTVSYYYMNKNRSAGRLSFEEYLDGNDFPINFPKYTDPSNPNKIIVNRVLYYENLMAELDDVFCILGIPFNKDLGVYAKSEYRIDRRSYDELYTLDQAIRVGDIFSQELDLHGYEF